MKEITYVTGNWAKVASAKQILEPLGFKINNVKMDPGRGRANQYRLHWNWSLC